MAAAWTGAYLRFYLSMPSRCSSSQRSTNCGPSCTLSTGLSLRTQDSSRIRCCCGSWPLVWSPTHRYCGRKLTLIAKLLYKMPLLIYLTHLLFQGSTKGPWVFHQAPAPARSIISIQDQYHAQDRRGKGYLRILAVYSKTPISKRSLHRILLSSLQSIDDGECACCVRSPYQNSHMCGVIGKCASRQIQHLSYNTPKVMSQGSLSPRHADAPTHTLLLSRISSQWSPEKDFENSSSTHADSDSLSSLDLPLEELPPPLMRPRTQQEVRLKYLQRLQGDGLLSDRPRKKVHHVVILDWDDTLFCTSHLSQLRVEHPSQLSPTLAAGMRELDSRAAKLLATALQLANVHIVTNSQPGWLHYTARAFLPHTLKLIDTFQVQIISARAAFQDIFPGDPQRWKTEAFTELLATEEKRTVTLNLVCIGDSRYEMQAAEHATACFEKRFVKTVKLKEKPRLDELSKQLLLVEEKLREVVRQTKGLSIRLEKK